MKLGLLFCFATAQLLAAQSAPDVVRPYGMGGRVDWCPTGNKVAFDEIVSDTAGGTGAWFDVMTATISSTGTLSNFHDLSLNSPFIPANPRRHVGNPAFSMDCTQMAIQVENSKEPCPTATNPTACEMKTSPGEGLYNDVYICSLNVSQTAFTGCKKVTSVSIALATWNGPIGGTLHPVFSHDSPSSRLCWGELTSLGTMSGVDGEGIWKIGCSQLTYTGAALTNVTAAKYVQPTVPGGQKKFYEFGSSGGRFGSTYGFFDDGWLYFVGNLKAGQLSNAYDVYRYNWNTGILQPLTNDTSIWNELPHISPSGLSLIWSSVRGNSEWTGAAGELPMLDMWQMQLPAPTDTASLGVDFQELTAFNHVGSVDYSASRLSTADQAWDATGKHFIICASHPQAEGILYVTLP